MPINFTFFDLQFWIPVKNLFKYQQSAATQVIAMTTPADSLKIININGNTRTQKTSKV
jgi:hypothetical protein